MADIEEKPRKIIGFVTRAQATNVPSMSVFLPAPSHHCIYLTAMLSYGFLRRPNLRPAQSLTKVTKWGPTSFDVRARSDVMDIMARVTEVSFLPAISSIVSVIPSHLYVSISKLNSNLETAKTVSCGVVSLYAERKERK